jgi:hypothetical protein
MGLADRGTAIGFVRQLGVPTGTLRQAGDLLSPSGRWKSVEVGTWFLKYAGIQQRVGHLFQSRIDCVEPADGRSARQGFYYLGQILYFDARIPDLLWVDYDIGPFFARAEAQVRLHLDIDTAGSYFVGQLIQDFFGPAKLAVDVLAYEADLFH